ncbi:MAG: hypothetical protein NZM44_01880 [Candidatus Calescibacterium sp.]|nr:hypothetical protein [Candidatus Calescibacterium sp.]
MNNINSNSYTTLAVGEEGGEVSKRNRELEYDLPGRPIPKGATQALGEGGIGELPPRYTTMALGEEGDHLTQAYNEAGDRVTTLAVGEEGEELSNPNREYATSNPGFTNESGLEAGDRVTTLAVGEEGGLQPCPINRNDLLQIYIQLLLLYLSQYNYNLYMSFGRVNG